MIKYSTPGAMHYHARRMGGCISRPRSPILHQEQCITMQHEWDAVYPVHDHLYYTRSNALPCKMNGRLYTPSMIKYSTPGAMHYHARRMGGCISRPESPILHQEQCITMQDEWEAVYPVHDHLYYTRGNALPCKTNGRLYTLSKITYTTPGAMHYHARRMGGCIPRP